MASHAVSQTSTTPKGFSLRVRQRVLPLREVERQHIIASLDILLYQLHALSFFLSPSLFLSFCRLVAQFICSKPRELDPERALRFFYIVCVLLNLPSICIHLLRGVVEGRAIILDFIGMSYSPSKFQLCFLDLFIILLQLLLLTISYGTSVYYSTEDADATDILLSRAPESTLLPPLIRKDSSILFPSQTAPSHLANVMPLVIDLRLKSITTHFHHAPLTPRTARNDSLLPLPNTSPFNLSGMRVFLRPARPMRVERRTFGPVATPSGRDMRMPGAMDTTPDR